MLNFLPQKNKKQIIFEYLLRVNIFLLIFIFLSSLILISLFFPSFFFAKYKNETISRQLEFTKQKNINNGEDPVLLIKNANRLISALDTAVSKLSYSEIINKIVSLKNKGIKILSIVITEENGAIGKKILVNGIANTRDGLTLFNNDIIADGSFKSAVFPVIDFVKSSNSEFSATLVL